MMKLLVLAISLALLAWIFVAWRKQKKELAEKSREIESLKRRGIEFVANVSHELKTPLTSIQGYAETLKSGALHDPEKAVQFLTRIEENAERLSLLVNDILDLAKIESPNLYLERVQFDPRLLFQDLERDFGFKLAQRKQTLKITCALTRLYADRKLFDQSIRNLVDNAHRYCQEGALIQIKGDEVTEQGLVYSRFVVSDNGPGISPEDLPRIFERFYRADKSRNRLLGGTGLGLAIVKHIMLSHGGLVRVSSDPNKGASFTLLFPLGEKSV
jgi:two-component system phosphate regulon sensor histidine kinase PhoR